MLVHLAILYMYCSWWLIVRLLEINIVSVLFHNCDTCTLDDTWLLKLHIATCKVWTSPLFLIIITTIIHVFLFYKSVWVLTRWWHTMSCDQKVPGSNPVWVGCCGVDIYQWWLTGLTKAWWCAKLSMVACT